MMNIWQLCTYLAINFVFCHAQIGDLQLACGKNVVPNCPLGWTAVSADNDNGNLNGGVSQSDGIRLCQRPPKKGADPINKVLISYGSYTECQGDASGMTMVQGTFQNGDFCSDLNSGVDNGYAQKNLTVLLYGETDRGNQSRDSVYQFRGRGWVQIRIMGCSG